VTIQAQILDLLRDLQRTRGMALVLVTHNMGVVADMARRVAVMYAGQVMEERAADDLFVAPQHPYTDALLAAMPERSIGHARLATIPGVVPGLYDRPSGCLFAPRCAYATRRCVADRPALRPWQVAGLVRCHYPMGDAARDRERLRDGPIERVEASA
jgi:dipeptide transport system ATP-binding protein